MRLLSDAYNRFPELVTAISKEIFCVEAQKNFKGPRYKWPSQDTTLKVRLILPPVFKRVELPLLTRSIP